MQISLHMHSWQMPNKYLQQYPWFKKDIIPAMSSLQQKKNDLRFWVKSGVDRPYFFGTSKIGNSRRKQLILITWGVRQFFHLVKQWLMG